MIETENSKEIWEAKYRYKDETEDEFYKRLVNGVFLNEKYIPEYSNIIGLDPDESFYDFILNIFSKHKGLMAGRGTYCLGTDRPQMVSNCFVIPIEKDSMEGIMEAAKNAALVLKMGGGCGYNFSIIRPKNSLIKKLQSNSSGSIPFIKIFDSVCSTIHSGGNRRGAQIAVLGVWHPDIEDFISCKRKGDLKNFNISVFASDKFMNAVKTNANWDLIFPDIAFEKYDEEWDGNINKWKEKGYPVKVYKTVKAKKLFDKITKANYEYAEPGFLFEDTINKNNNIKKIEYIQACNPCFHGDTLIPTKTGVFKIKDLVGKNVEVYNGEDWVHCDNFRQTGENQELLEITLYDGSKIKTTLNHNFYLSDGRKVKAANLEKGDKLLQNQYDLIYGDAEVKGAYLKGFLTGDGYTKKNGNCELNLYRPKYICKERLIKSASELPIVKTNTNYIETLSFNEGNKIRSRMKGLTCRDEDLFLFTSLYKKHIPNEIFQGTLRSKTEYIAGVMDADGCALNSKYGFGYQICSINKEWLLDFQNLLKSIGVYSRISIANEKQSKLFPNSEKEYKCKKCWRITIHQKDSIILSNYIDFSRLKSFKNREIKRHFKSKYNKIVDIKNIGIEEKVYCCTIDSNHKITISNGVIVGNCGEAVLPPYGNCLLGSINLSKFVNNVFIEDAEINLDEFKKTVKAMIIVLDKIVDIGVYPLEKQKEEALNKRAIGLGITGLADMLCLLCIKYSSNKAIEIIDNLMKEMAIAAYETSCELAKLKGPFPLFYKEIVDSEFIKQMPGYLKENIKKYGLRNARMLSVAPTGTMSLLMNNCSSGIEPIFSLEYQRKIKKGEEETIVSLENNAWRMFKEKFGTIYIPDFFQTINDISIDNHIEMQATVQKYIDMSISKTINVPKDCHLDNFKNIYLDAWEKGLKGCTTYRPNDILGSVLLKDNRPNNITYCYAPKRPEILKYERFNVLGHKVLIGLFNNNPYECFILETEKKIPTEGYIKKLGRGKYSLLDNEKNVIIENIIDNEIVNDEIKAITRLVSSNLRHGVPIDFTVEQLNKCGNSISTYPKMLGRVLKKYKTMVIKKETEELCPECKDILFKYDGCLRCKCGYSKCG